MQRNDFMKARLDRIRCQALSIEANREIVFDIENKDYIAREEIKDE